MAGPYTRISHGSPGNDSSSTDAVNVINALEVGLEAVEAAYLPTTTAAATYLPISGLRTAIPVGNYFQTSPAGSNGYAGTATQGVCVFWPFLVPFAMTVSECRVNVTSAAAAGASWRLGFYQLAANGYQPGTLIADIGTVDPTGTGVKALTGLSVALPAGIAFGALALQGTGSGGGLVTGGFPNISLSHSATLGVVSNAVYATGVTAGLASTPTIAGASGAAPIPVLELKRSA